MKSKLSAEAKREMIDGLVEQRLCCRDRKIALWLARNGAKLERLGAGTELISEGAVDREVFCIIAGRFDVLIGGHYVGERKKGEHVGEMAMILKEPRTASLIAAEDSTVVRITERIMRRAYDKFPCMWEPIADTLCKRLHERRKFFRAKNKRPRVFVGSSGARRYVAEELKTQLSALVDADISVWVEEDIFKPSSTTLEALIDQSKRCDFGIFIFGADDKVTSKGNEFKAPRDNVVFEGGMFTGSCGIRRTFFLCEDHKKLKMPSDLNGVTFLNFKCSKRPLQVNFGRSMNRLAEEIKQLGPV